MRFKKVARWLSLGVGLAALAGSAVVIAQEAAKPAAQSGPRRDPKGVKGISPFWEAVVKGDKAYIVRDFDGALSAYREALSHEPQNPMGHYRMGEAHLAKGEMDEAQAAWETASRFAGKNATLKGKILFVLADLQERKRSYNDATNGWNGYEGHAKAQPSAKMYPATPADRKKRIAEWRKLEEDYGAVKERIKKRLEEADKASRASSQSPGN